MSRFCNLGGNSFGERFSALAEGIKSVLGVGGLWKENGNEKVALIERISDNPFNYSRDTIKITTQQNRLKDSAEFRRSVDSVNEVKKNTFYNQIKFLGRDDWK